MGKLKWDTDQNSVLPVHVYKTESRHTTAHWPQGNALENQWAVILDIGRVEIGLFSLRNRNHLWGRDVYTGANQNTKVQAVRGL
jgi:hypothetical protein